MTNQRKFILGCRALLLLLGIGGMYLGSWIAWLGLTHAGWWTLPTMVIGGAILIGSPATAIPCVFVFTDEDWMELLYDD